MNLIIFAILPLVFIGDRIQLKRLKSLFTIEGIKVFLDDNESINAYIIGKNLVITKGFLRLDKSEQRAILAHEMSHMVLNHYLKMKILVAVGLIFSLFLFQFNIVLSLISLILVFLLQKFVSKRQEIQADRLAYSIVGDELKLVIKKYGDVESSIFSSHPTINTRLKMLSF
ncbi:M48 family metalloprotease [Sulfolobus sp. S-194]|uniref:M48 family metallopeptidase n=1 Tax=Sulfolobus sp. S-194 TaxID=2512240 RepID=UPI00143BB93C|nr:M48 family metalloprotease [Sulfolobus sp. S-194]